MNRTLAARLKRIPARAGKVIARVNAYFWQIRCDNGDVLTIAPSRVHMDIRDKLRIGDSVQVQYVVDEVYVAQTDWRVVKITKPARRRAVYKPAMIS